MSYWPAFEVPSWKALAKNESYGSVRNSTFVPVAASNIGRIVAFNGVRAPSSNAPMTSLPPAWAALGLAATLLAGGVEAAGTDAAAAGVPVVAGPQAATTAPAAATPPTASPRRSRSLRVRYRDRMSSSLIASLLLSD